MSNRYWWLTASHMFGSTHRIPDYKLDKISKIDSVDRTSQRKSTSDPSTHVCWSSSRPDDTQKSHSLPLLSLISGCLKSCPKVQNSVAYSSVTPYMEGIWTLEISIWLDRLWGLEVHQVLEAPGYPKEKMIYKGKLCATPIFSETTRAGFGEPLQHQSTAVDWSRTCTKEIKASTLLLSDPSNREFKPQGVPVDSVGKFPSKWWPLTKRGVPGYPKPKSDPKKPDLAGGPPAVEEKFKTLKVVYLCQWSEICHASDDLLGDTLNT